MSSSSSHSRGAHGHGHGHGHEGGGPLVKVGFARTQAEAEMMQALLLDAGIPAVLKRSRGFDNPDFLAAGPHDLFVGSDLAARARELLDGTMLESEADERAELSGALRRAGGAGGEGVSPGRLALWVGVAFALAVLLIWVLYQLS